MVCLHWATRNPTRIGSVMRYRSGHIVQIPIGYCAYSGAGWVWSSIYTVDELWVMVYLQWRRQTWTRILIQWLYCVIQNMFTLHRLGSLLPVSVQESESISGNDSSTDSDSDSKPNSYIALWAFHIAQTRTQIPISVSDRNPSQSPYPSPYLYPDPAM